MTAKRLRPAFADIRAVVAKARERFPNAKIALVGTSAGTVSVGNALQRPRPAQFDDARLLLRTTARRHAAVVAFR